MSNSTQKPKVDPRAMDGISRVLTQCVKQLAERYQTPLPQQASRVAELEQNVNGHLVRMGFSWK